MADDGYTSMAVRGKRYSQHLTLNYGKWIQEQGTDKDPIIQELRTQNMNPKLAAKRTSTAITTLKLQMTMNKNQQKKLVGTRPKTMGEASLATSGNPLQSKQVKGR